MAIKQLIKNIFNTFGVDIIKTCNSPELTMLGLTRLPIQTILDIGANTGQFASHISKKFPKAKIYSFEPIPSVFQDLKRLEGNSLKGRLTALNLAIGEKDGCVDMFVHRNHNSSSSLLKTSDFCETIYPFTKEQSACSVQVKTLDNCLSELNISIEPDLLVKMDVQGYEDRVIKGGANAFQKARACLLEAGVDVLYENQANFKDLCVMLYDLGFHYAGNIEQVYANDGHAIFVDSLFVKY